jgi:hypothetical protein
MDQAIMEEIHLSSEDDATIPIPETPGMAAWGRNCHHCPGGVATQVPPTPGNVFFTRYTLFKML